ncbi:MAG: potassium transporter Trk [Planctomycetota bacterium]|nr:MAG: potassium transporter Trk [Planctomycetota bacterium]
MSLQSNGSPPEEIQPITLEAPPPRRHWATLVIDRVCLVIGVVLTIVHQGVRELPLDVDVELTVLAVVLWGAMLATLLWRLRLYREEGVVLQRERAATVTAMLGAAAIVAAVVGGVLAGRGLEAARALGVGVELAVVFRAAAALGALVRHVVAEGRNAAVVFAGSFLVLIAIGTSLLMLPRAIAAEKPPVPLGERFRIALFTATSASCVTGLIVVPTGGESPYWSPVGQMVILLLFQIGGLGIMTWSVVFAMLAGRHLQLREAQQLHTLFDLQSPGEFRRTLLTIGRFVVVIELLGALGLWGLWPAEWPWSKRAFYSVFHSVSAFCNAGFSLTENSFVDMAYRPQVVFLVPLLIIVGGLGFPVLQNLSELFVKWYRESLRWLGWERSRRVPIEELERPARLSLNSRLVLLTTAVLLVGGTLAYFILESVGSPTFAHRPFGQRLAEAFFQSVTFRTAGFNTVDHAQLGPATKLLAIGLMFIGASPGSTGGGVKTTVFAVAVLAIVSTLRGRTVVECHRRTLPDRQVRGALTLMTLGLMALMTSAILVVLFEAAPAGFLDQLYEVTSAFGTVGVSTGITASLKPQSQYVLILTMFVGRVGPLTLLMTLPAPRRRAIYQFPEERVTLG